MPLLRRRYWIFDLDGTLTVPIHDFDGMRRRLGLSPGQPLLEGIEAMGHERATMATQEIHAWEDDLAERAAAQPDAADLVARLEGLGARLGVLTRNRTATALRTLDVIGMASFFREDDVIGRDRAAPKPSPAGLQALLSAWGADAGSAVMVGDGAYDVEAGRAAGIDTVLVEREGPARYRDRATIVVQGLHALEVDRG